MPRSQTHPDLTADEENMFAGLKINRYEPLSLPSSYPRRVSVRPALFPSGTVFSDIFALASCFGSRSCFSFVFPLAGIFPIGLRLLARILSGGGFRLDGESLGARTTRPISRGLFQQARP